MLYGPGWICPGLFCFFALFCANAVERFSWSSMLDHMRNIIEVTGLTKLFGNLVAVNNLSLEVLEGESFGLLGPNGAGKTTTIKMLTTLLLPTSGSAKIGGYDVVKNAYEVRKIIGYVPQLISTDPMLTGLENLTVFAKLYDVPARTRKSQINEAFEFMGLMDAKNKLVKNYSGGMVRRLEIAQSLLHKPKVLFLDEPTVGLDPVARKMMWEHIAKLKTEFGTTIFLTTHYMEEADRLCDRVAIMDRGKMSATGTPDSLKDSLGIEGATLDDVFVRYTGNALDEGAGFKDTRRTRRVAKRLG